MAPSTSISVAQQLQGALATVSIDEGFRQTESALAMSGLALELTHFTEEGVQMFPEVLVTSSVEQVARALQAQDRLRLGTSPSAADAISKLLKQAAPLCRDGWMAYVQLESAIEYGVIRQSSSPLALPLSDGIRGCDSPALLFYKSVSGAVRIIGAKGSSVDVNLHTARPSADGVDPIKELAGAIVEELPASAREVATSCMTKVLSKALRAGHGALVAVVPSATTTLPDDLFTGDNVVTLPAACCMDFGVAVQACMDRITLNEADAFGGAANLLIGMMMSDGVTVFTASGRVLAYRAFLSPRATTATGGARRRAYMTLTERVGSGLSAAFMRSQDGQMEIKIQKMPGVTP